jgi:hypothetical protein
MKYRGVSIEMGLINTQQSGCRYLLEIVELDNIVAHVYTLLHHLLKGLETNGHSMNTTASEINF